MGDEVKRYLRLAVGLVMAAGGLVGAGARGQQISSGSADKISHYSNPMMIRTELVRHPEQTDEILQAVTRSLVENLGDPALLANDRNLFSEVLWHLNSDSSHLSRNQANRTANALLPVFKEHRGIFSDNGTVISDFIFRFGETSQVKAFILDNLRGNAPNSPLEKRAILGLYWGHTFRKDPEISDALYKIIRRAPNDFRNATTYTSLGALSKLDINRAAPILKRSIERASDIFTFNKISSIVSDTHHPELMRALFTKFHSFKYVGPSLSGDPSIGISKESVVEYVAHVEAEDLERSLDVLFRIGGHPPQSQAALIQKLKSSDTRSRRAVLNYCLREIQRGAFINEDMHAALQAHLHRETDAVAVAAAQDALARIKDRLRNTQR